MDNNIDFHLRRGYFIYSSEEDFFVTVTDYNSNGEVTKERPISKRELDFISKATTKDSKQSTIVDHKSTHRLILFQNFPFELVWKVKGEKRTLISSSGEKEVDVPDTIFHVQDKKLMVYFHKVTKKGHLITPCTYPNVFKDYVCLGNVKVKDHLHLLSDEMKRWESYFFDTKFTGDDFTVSKKLKYVKVPWNL